MSLRRPLTYGATIAAVLGIWTALSATGAVQPLLLASPADTWRALRVLANDPSTLLAPVGATVRETLIAFLIAAIVALPLGLGVGSSRVLRRAYEPLFTSLNALPLVILYPVLAASLGVGGESKIALGTLYAFFPIVIATTRAAANVDRQLITAAVTMGANRGQRVTQVVFPFVLPAALAGMRVSLGLTLVTVIAAEFISGDAGVGYELGAASQVLDTPTLFAWIVVACMLTIAINVAFTAAAAALQKGIYR